MTPIFDEKREYYFGIGAERDCADYFGAHKTDDGVVFRVWAPNADAVYLAGDFNAWSADCPMRKSSGGVWAVLIDDGGFAEGSCYKYIIERNGSRVFKADPFAFWSECRERTASRFYDISRFEWTDGEWKRSISDNRFYFNEDRALPKPINIYEVHAGSWRRGKDGSEYNWHRLADELSEYVTEMGYTHVELLPITEYPFDGSWGYQTTGYYAPTSRYGEPKDFAYFVNRMHMSGIGVILDWVPAHFAKDAHGLYEFDGAPLYEYQGKDMQENKGWGTRCFDLGRSEVRSFLISNALFWLEKYHVDGLRVDAVASMLYLDYGKEAGEWNPNPDGSNINYRAVEFFRLLSEAVRTRCPDCMLIAEESTAYAGVTKRHGLGFTHKWNMGWMNDTLSYVATDPYFRSGNHYNMTFASTYAFCENYVLPISHDEVVHGKKSLLDKCFGSYEQKFATAKAYITYMMTHPGKKLMFMGCELALFREWTEKDELEWFMLGYDKHRSFREFVKRINHLYLSLPELWEVDGEQKGMEWVFADNRDDNIYVYRRFDSAKNCITSVLNFSAVMRDKYSIPVNEAGYYKILLNTEDKKFGGEGCSYRAKRAKKTAYGFAVELTLPALSGIIIQKSRR